MVAQLISPNKTLLTLRFAVLEWARITGSGMVAHVAPKISGTAIVFNWEAIVAGIAGWYRWDDRRVG